MAGHITRVELHFATPRDYEKLNTEMEARGFTRKFFGDDGVLYNLPTAQYFSTVPLPIKAVRDLARQAANTTGKECSVLSTQFTQGAWFGLSKA